MLEIELTEGGWLDGLSDSALKSIDVLLDSGKSEEQVAEMWLSTQGPSSTLGFGSNGSLQNFYENVKQEFIDFVCGDPRYEEDRVKAFEIWNKHGKTALVSAVSVIISGVIGLAAAAIIPVVALLFSLLSKIGVNAFCSSCKEKNLLK